MVKKLKDALILGATASLSLWATVAFVWTVSSFGSNWFTQIGMGLIAGYMATKFLYRELIRFGTKKG